MAAAPPHLRPIAVGPCVGHGQDAGPRVAQHKVLVFESAPVDRFSARSCARWVERGGGRRGVSGRRGGKGDPTARRLPAVHEPFPAVMSPPWHMKLGIILIGERGGAVSTHCRATSGNGPVEGGAAGRERPSAGVLARPPGAEVAEIIARSRDDVSAELEDEASHRLHTPCRFCAPGASRQHVWRG